MRHPACLMYHLPGHAADRTTLLVTREIRWFFDGDAPRALFDWLNALPGDRALEARSDHYDLVAARTGAGVKYRDGQFMDSKFRLSARELTTLPRPFNGTVEDWAKISTPISPDGPPPPEEFVRVDKQLVTKRVTADTIATSAEVGEAGCEIEIASITTPAGPAWSLCFESFGPPETRATAFRIGIDAAANEPFPTTVVLASGYNGGYPVWIAGRERAASPDNVA